jgi:hypothetical protein
MAVVWLSAMAHPFPVHVLIESLSNLRAKPENKFSV